MGYMDRLRNLRESHRLRIIKNLKAKTNCKSLFIIIYELLLILYFYV